LCLEEEFARRLSLVVSASSFLLPQKMMVMRAQALCVLVFDKYKPLAKMRADVIDVRGEDGAALHDATSTA
jgi:hypothetical protein